jgi:hypothetical protein
MSMYSPTSLSVMTMQVINCARRRGETAIGFIDDSGELNLAPSGDCTQSYDRNSHIIAIAEQL